MSRPSRHLGNMANVLRDFKPGPLDFYREKASFNWKKLKVFLDGEEIIKFQNKIYEALREHPDYGTHKDSTLSFDKQRKVAAREAVAYKSMDLLSLPSVLEDFKRSSAVTRIMMAYAPASSIKHIVTNTLFTTGIMGMGTERHYKYINLTDEGKITGCYCLTEIGHGSNARGMRTTATYDKVKKVFILNSPDFEAAKCWAGGLGQGATHGIIYAQLILNNNNYGLHAFVVKIRDPKTYLSYPGLIVGDMGEKIGLNGLDNGFVLFNKYEIPRENLLNKVADVTEDGLYVTPIKDPNKRYGAALGALSGGRVNITCICETMGTKALTIAIRYAAVRKQFGPENEDELPILEYQNHQYRLLPYLAAAYVLRIFNTYFCELHYQFSVDNLTGNNKENGPDLGMEIHAISSGCKPLAGWIMKKAIQECREACGGHGYLKVSGIGEIRNEHDANLTYEGENHVLIQQTSNWILKFWPLLLEKQRITTPMKSANFLSNGLEILKNSKLQATNTDEMCSPEVIIATYQWLVCYLLKNSYNKMQNDLNNGKTSFWAKNNNQVFYSKNLAVTFIQHFFLQRMLVQINEAPDVTIKNVLKKLFSLYGLWSLEKHIPTLYQGGFAVGETPTTLIQDSILKMCADLKNDAVSLVDAVALPDFIVNSVLGMSDGEVYNHLQSALYRSPYAMGRPTWWQEINDLRCKTMQNKL